MRDVYVRNVISRNRYANNAGMRNINSITDILHIGVD